MTASDDQAGISGRSTTAVDADDEPTDGAGPAGDAAEDAEDAEDEAPNRRLRNTIEWVAVIVGAIVVALLVRMFLFTTFWIPSGSMEPTLSGENRDRVIVNRLSYKLHDVNRGDIIVFSVPPGEQLMEIDGEKVKDLIKRVVGLPGETVELRDGDVFIDGEELPEPYLPDGTTTEPCGPDQQTTFEIPDDAVFVMGDNRDHSRDARCWEEHWVDESDIVGRAFLRFWPLGDFGGL